MKKLLLVFALIVPASLFAQCPTGYVPISTAFTLANPATGNVNSNNILTSGLCINTTTFAVTLGSLGTTANCNSSASPAVCSSDSSGHVNIAASATSVVVDSKAVTADSDILVTFDSTLGTALGVTCNTTYAAPYVTARTAGTCSRFRSGLRPLQTQLAIRSSF